MPIFGSDPTRAPVAAFDHLLFTNIFQSCNHSELITNQHSSSFFESLLITTYLSFSLLKFNTSKSSFEIFPPNTLGYSSIGLNALHFAQNNGFFEWVFFSSQVMHIQFFTLKQASRIYEFYLLENLKNFEVKESVKNYSKSYRKLFFTYKLNCMSRILMSVSSEICVSQIYSIIPYMKTRSELEISFKFCSYSLCSFNSNSLPQSCSKVLSIALS